jgi:sialate O-acetylesterase
MLRHFITTFLMVTFQLLLAAIAVAEVKLPQVLGEHMVLQRDQPITLWGTASPGEEVSVTLGQETQKTVTDPHGHWLVRMNPRPASDQPTTLTVAASNTITLTDVLIGEVWLCSGQSNMHWPIKQSDDGEADAAHANLPNVRLLNLRGSPYPNGREFTEQELATCKPEKYLSGNWAACSTETASEFSAVAFYFGRELHGKLNVPVGLIHNAIGGTPTEAWISREALESDPALRPLLGDWFNNELVHSFCRDRAAFNLREAIDKKVLDKRQYRHPYQPGFMFEAGIAPLAPFSIRGVIWYQGESNAHNSSLHDKLLPALIAEWRRVWGQGDFPFLYVQLPNIASVEEWPEFRESQRRASRIAHTGMAVTIDIGDPADVHPRRKGEVGHRLALLARAMAYGEEIEFSGPRLEAVIAAGNRLRLSFSHTAGGLMTKDNEEFGGFEVAGSDNVFAPATAEREGDEIILFSSQVEEPVAVRYAFTPNPRCVLVNGDRLPASPFTAHLRRGDD